METEYIKEFAVLASILNYSDAADELHISQSNLSRHMQKLEADIGGDLIDRRSRQIGLTDLGMRFLGYANRITALLSDAEHDIGGFIREKNHDILFGAVGSMQYFGVNYYLIGFRQSHPEYHVNVLELPDKERLNLFYSGRLNVCAAYFEKNYEPDHGFIETNHGRVVAFIPKSDPMSAYPEIKIADLKDKPLIVPPRRGDMYDFIKMRFAHEGIVPNILYEGNPTAALDYVRAGMGIAIQPSEFISWYSSEDIHLAEISPRMEYRYGLAYRTDKRLSPGEKALVKYVRDKVE